MDNEMTFTLGYKVSMTFMPVEPGTFVMGDEDEVEGYDWSLNPKHKVAISKRFWLSQFLVTRQQWQFVMGHKTYKYQGGIDLPVDNVSWEDAMAFCTKLNEKFGSQLPEDYEFFLPTEAQWEYACRTGLEPECALNEFAWYGKFLKLRPVGQKKPNKWGLYDMLGNVWEWVYDWYNAFPYNLKDLADGSVTEWRDPVGVGAEHQIYYHIARGGYYHSSAKTCTPSYRELVHVFENVKNKHIGFRVAIRPKNGYFAWDEYDELARRGLALEEGENDVECDKLCREEKDGMTFCVFGDRHRDDPHARYFKLYDGWMLYQSKKTIRIKFTAPEYQLHRNTDGMPDWILSPEEKVHLMKILTANDCDLWKQIIYMYNDACIQNREEWIPEDLPVPDYTKLPDKIGDK